MQMVKWERCKYIDSAAARLLYEAWEIPYDKS